MNITKQDKIDSIVAECAEQGVVQDEKIAYILATAEWETNHTFDPVKEAYWLSEDWRERNLRYYPYYGRGYVQLTWEENYSKYGVITGAALVANPDLALEPATARMILVHGFVNGTFTGRKISDYINTKGVDFYNSRRCINGTDKAAEIAQIAEEFLAGKSWDLPA